MIVPSHRFLQATMKIYEPLHTRVHRTKEKLRKTHHDLHSRAGTV